MPFIVFSCFFVEKMEMVSGSNERTSSSPLSLSSRTSAAVAKSSSTRNPSASYAAFWPSLSSALGALQGRLLPQVTGLPVRPAASLPPHNALVLILHQLRYQPPSSCVAELPDGNPPRAGSQDLQVGVLEPREQGHVGPSRRAPFPPSAASGSGFSGGSRVPSGKRTLASLRACSPPPSGQRLPCDSRHHASDVGSEGVRERATCRVARDWEAEPWPRRGPGRQGREQLEELQQGGRPAGRGGG